MIWESPIYRFREPFNETSVNMKEVVIDVTGSAPSAPEPSENFQSVVKEIFGSSEFSGIEDVLEFGAAKLKNIPFLLQQGKNVTAVEFKKLADNEITKRNIRRCRRFKTRYKELIFPNPFLSDANKYDLIILANVIPVMPVFAERLYLLDALYRKVKEGKYVLWIAFKETGDYKNIREGGRQNIGDGIWRGTAARFKTFYKYHPPEKLDELMQLYGFECVKKWNLTDDARLYKKTNNDLFSELITPELIQEHIPLDTEIADPERVKLKRVKKEQARIVIPNPDELCIGNLYKKKIQSINVGADPELYHRVVSLALARIFQGSLRNMDIKVEINGGIKIIDTVFTNSATSGFFNNHHDRGYVIVEVKNISGDPGNPEFDQLNGRLNAYRGHFGILVCRSIQDKNAVIQRCKTYLPDNNILFLTDEDIFELLNYSKNESLREIDDLMDNRQRDITF